MLFFLTFNVLVANPRELLYTVAHPARGLMDREKNKKRKSGSNPPPPHAARTMWDWQPRTLRPIGRKYDTNNKLKQCSSIV